jgi:hypothetical protein
VPPNFIGFELSVIGLDTARAVATAADPVLSTNWGLAKDWSEQKRYHRITEAEARALYDAVADAAHGVLPWIKTQW